MSRKTDNTQPPTGAPHQHGGRDRRERPSGPPGGFGRHGGPPGMGEKPKNFRRAIGQIIAYLGSYKYALLAVLIFAVGSTIFGILGPKILGEAITELFNGLIAKVTGTGGIDFGKIASILLFLLRCTASAPCSVSSRAGS